ncbi:MAG: LPS assembly lipoprotein LptE [Candidatus Magnetoovum sp. WYHC-5]|nr:LPS assembly lipoprotein LptE [Candidatus Magnetoovum sp. WYHC-5]
MKKSLLLIFILLFGCGYKIVGTETLNFDSVRIGKIVNATTEPKLEDKLYFVLTEEFMKRGVTVTDQSENVIDGTITDFTTRILSEKLDYAVEYEIVITGDFVLRRGDEKIKEIKGMMSPFIESYKSPEYSEKINPLTAAKEIREEEALRVLSKRLISNLAY